jgi:membrane protein YqaA with SNARE-associated domain
MVFFLIKFKLDPWLVLICGVPGSTLGRYLLSLYIPKISKRFLKAHKKADLEFVGKKLNHGLGKAWLFVLLYSITPLSTTALFMAAGIAKVRPILVVPPFFVGKFISDAVMIFLGRSAVGNAEDVLHGTYSLKGIIMMVLGCVIVGAFLFVDWQTLLVRKKLKFNFNIWK